MLYSIQHWSSTATCAAALELPNLNTYDWRIANLYTISCDDAAYKIVILYDRVIFDITDHS